MKKFALLAVSLMLSTSTTFAQAAKPQNSAIKVIDTAVVTFYQVATNENFVVECAGGIRANSDKGEFPLDGRTHFKCGDSFQVYADKAFMKKTDTGFCILIIKRWEN